MALKFLKRPNSAYTDTEVPITDDIDDAGFAVLYSKLSVTWNSSCQYNNSNITDSCEPLFRIGKRIRVTPIRLGHRLGSSFLP